MTITKLPWLLLTSSPDSATTPTNHSQTRDLLEEYECWQREMPKCFVQFKMGKICSWLSPQHRMDDSQEDYEHKFILCSIPALFFPTYNHHCAHTRTKFHKYLLMTLELSSRFLSCFLGSFSPIQLSFCELLNAPIQCIYAFMWFNKIAADWRILFHFFFRC